MPVNLTPLYAEETEKASQEQLYTLVKLAPPASVTGVEPLFLVDNNFPVSFGYVDEVLSTDDITYDPFPLKLQGITTTTDGSIDKTSITVGNVSREIMHYVEHYNGLSKWRVTFRFVYSKFLNYTYGSDGAASEVENINADSLAYVEEEFLIDTYAATEQYVTFQLEPIINLSIQVPRRRFMSDSCGSRYKESSCKFAPNGAEFYLATVAGSTTFHAIMHTGAALSAGSTFTFVGRPEVYTVASITTNAGGIISGILLTSAPLTLDGDAVLPTCLKTLKDCKARGNQLNFGGFPGVTGNRRLII